jgi:hypothetical protein
MISNTRCDLRGYSMKERYFVYFLSRDHRLSPLHRVDTDELTA